MDIGDAKLKISTEGVEEAEDKLKKLGASIQEMSDTFKKAGKALVGFGAAIAGVLAVTVYAYAEEEKGIIRLSTAMRNVGLDYEANKESIEGLINTLQQKTAIADSEQRDSLASLIRITRNTAEAFDLLELSMNIAVGTGRDLESATRNVMYALGDNWGEIQQLIPALKFAQTEEEKWMMLRELFVGQAEEYGKSMAGQFALLKANIGDIAEAIGSVLAPVVKDIAEKVVDLTEWIKRLNPRVVDLGTKAAVAAAGILTLVGGMTLLFVYVPKVTAAMKAMAVWMTGTLIPALGRLIAITWAHVAALVAQLAMMGPVGWAMLAAGVALAVGAIYGLVKGTQALIDTLFEVDDALAGTVAAVEAAGYSVAKLIDEEQALGDEVAQTAEEIEIQAAVLQEQIDTLRDAGYEVKKLADAEYDLSNAVKAANTALSKQEIDSLRAAIAKGNLAEAAERLGLTEQEAQAFIAKANEEMTNQEVVAYAAAQNKKTLKEIADELGISERKLTRILQEANTGLERQSNISPISEWSLGATIAPVPAFQMGAIVTRPTLGVIGEAGPEAVIPLSGMSAATVNYNIEIKPGAIMGNEAEARQWARILLDYIRQDQRRSRSVSV